MRKIIFPKVSNKVRKRFLLFLGFYGHFCAEKRFFGLFLAIFVPKNPKNAKIKNLSHKSLELLIYYVWCDFWPKKMIFGRLDTILVIFQKSRFKSQFSIETPLFPKLWPHITRQRKNIFTSGKKLLIPLKEYFKIL